MSKEDTNQADKLFLPPLVEKKYEILPLQSGDKLREREKRLLAVCVRSYLVFEERIDL